MDVVVGVDSHKKTLEAVALDGVGRVLSRRRFSNDLRGHREFHTWIVGHGENRIVGIECSGTYGSRLAKLLQAEGEDVREVPGNLSYVEARRRNKGKSDAIDAEAVARVVLREPDSLPKAKDGTNEDLKLLSDQRARMIRARTAELNRIHAHMVHLCAGYQDGIGILKKEKGLKTVMRLVRGNSSLRAELARGCVAEVRRLNRMIKDIESRLGALVATSGDDPAPMSRHRSDAGGPYPR